MVGFIEKLPNWLRWPLTPIASVICFIVVSVVGSIAARILVFFSGPRGGWSDNFFDYLVIPAVAGFCAVSIVAFVAPKAKRMATIIIAGVWILLAGAATFFSVLSSDWKNLLFIIALIVGAGYAPMNMENYSTQSEKFV